MAMANRAAQKLWSVRFSGRHPFEEEIEDAASTALLAYYDTEEAKRPANAQEFEIFAYARCKMALGKVRTRRNLEVFSGDMKGGGSGRIQDNEIEKMERILMKYNSISVVQQPVQISFVQVQDLLRALGKTPQECQDAARALIDYGDIIEFARERKVSLFDAMKEQSRLREIIKRILGDDADEKKFAETSSVPSPHAKGEA